MKVRNFRIIIVIFLGIYMGLPVQLVEEGLVGAEERVLGTPWHTPVPHLFVRER